MSSNIKTQTICQHCGNEFTAQTVAEFCSDACAKQAHNLALGNASNATINANNQNTAKASPAKDGHAPLDPVVLSRRGR